MLFSLVLIRYTDTRDDEKYRKMSIRSTPISLVLEDLTGNSYLINIIDVPGHLDFSDEMTSSLRLTDGAVLVVDASQGVLVSTRKAITHAIQEHLPIVVVINKVDHLFSAFRMTPEEAYKHLEQLISSINDHITTEEGGLHVNPLTGNICFSSALFGISFTLSSFAKKHVANFGLKCDALEFASHLWGDSYYDADKKAFMKEPPAVGRERCFVQYILEPFNRLRTQVLENDQDNLKKTLFEFGVRLPDETLTIKRFEDCHLLMRLAFSSVFGKVTGFTDMVVHHIPSVKEAASRKVNRIYRGCKKSLIKSMCNCDKAGPLMVDITKLYPTSDCSGSYALGRVYSGVIRKGQAVCVLTEDFEDEGDMAEVTNIWLYQACYRVPIIEASPGSLVVIEGVSDGIEKSATLCDEKGFDFFIPPQFNTPSVLKVVFEASNPFELGAVLTQLCKTFPLATVKRIKYYGGIEIQGPGKLYLDSIIKELRIYSKVKIKILHWAVLYRETVLESSEKCFSTTKNKCTIAMIAEPLDEIAEDLHMGILIYC
ncbi:110 kDa U5 small nuclear ribonucleoprotein component CLO-like isoform X2 [Chenopodium quinoa]|uniref:110 kDa U5 small nuclear ribonucleoprotein component CLO-like isoform X2 n=1 Tax=Chenopodium quinoa TaxID=63459 RepID=UPI000B78E0D4|nr:110 kDa U5 small nuclear ribonucleoprotein component CLO-like isoform X2 [Chenopodium quinoa]